MSSLPPPELLHRSYLLCLARFLALLRFKYVNLLAMTAWSGAACRKPALRALITAEALIFAGMPSASKACLQAASTGGSALRQLSSAARQSSRYSRLEQRILHIERSHLGDMDCSPWKFCLCNSVVLADGPA